MNMQVQRMREGKNSLLSRVYIDDRFFCYGLEYIVPRSGRNMRRPAIPQGVYRLGLRRYGATHARYSRRFPDIHKGVLHLLDVPDQKYAYIQVGKFFCETEGGLLVGKGFQMDDFGDYRLKKSAKAYKELYPYIIGAALNGTVEFNSYK